MATASIDKADRIIVGLVEAAEMLSISHRHLQKMCNNESLGLERPPHFRMGDRWLFPVASLRIWAERQALRACTPKAKTPELANV